MTDPTNAVRVDASDLTYDVLGKTVTLVNTETDERVTGVPRPDRSGRVRHHLIPSAIRGLRLSHL